MGKLRHGAANRARGAAPHLPTGLGQAPFVVFRSPPSIAPEKPSEKGGSEAAREHGEQGGGGGGNARERKADGNQRRRIPGEKSPGRKRAAFLVMGFGNNIQADPFPLGSSQAARGARSEAHGSENTAAVLFQTLLRDTGPVLRGREPPACETPPLVKHNLPCNARPARKTAPRPPLHHGERLERAGKSTPGPFFFPKKQTHLTPRPKWGKRGREPAARAGAEGCSEPPKKRSAGGLPCREGPSSSAWKWDRGLGWSPK